MRLAAFGRRLSWCGLLCLCLLVLSLRAPVASPLQSDPNDWAAVLAEAKGQEVYFNAWGGDQRINDYLAWAAEQLWDRHGITLKHVKVADIGEAVTRVLAEKSGGAEAAGSVDLVWINGENFAAMKQNGLLFGPFTERLPNWRLVDLEGNPTALLDFTVSTEGLEAPWGRALFNLLYDSGSVAEPPRSFEALLTWAEANLGRLTYPKPPDFMGTTFLKQGLIALTPDPQLLLAPPKDQASFEQATAPLWDFLDRLTPLLWRQGQHYPASGPAQRQLLADGALDFAFSFNPGDLDSAIALGLLPETTKAYLFDDGSLGNSHFLAIPYNAKAKAAALVTIDFLLSPEAQARKADPRIWGDPSVLAIDQLAEAERRHFQRLPNPPRALTAGLTAPVLDEPHPDWTQALEAAWTARYGR